MVVFKLLNFLFFWFFWFARTDTMVVFKFSRVPGDLRNAPSRTDTMVVFKCIRSNRHRKTWKLEPTQWLYLNNIGYIFLYIACCLEPTQWLYLNQKEFLQKRFPDLLEPTQWLYLNAPFLPFWTRRPPRTDTMVVFKLQNTWHNPIYLICSNRHNGCI